MKRYGIACGLVIGTLALKTFLRSSAGDIAAFHLLLLPVILSAWYGGFGPGVFATMFAYGLNYFFFTSHEVKFLSVSNVILAAFFFAEGLLISIISEARRQADSDKDEFIGFTSHELKNPLAAIKGYVGLLQRKAKKIHDISVRNYIYRIDQQTDKILQLVQELLDITKLQAGKFEYHDTTFSVPGLIEEVIQDQSVAAKSHRILLKSSSEGFIHADRNRIEQVITNLITNAIKYSPKNPEVMVDVLNKKYSVTISVKDFGIGISKESQEKVFHQFYRDKIGEKTAEGLGLGLYISSLIVKHYNGNIWVKSTKGKGSTFFVELPIVKNATKSHHAP